MQMFTCISCGGPRDISSKLPYRGMPCDITLVNSANSLINCLTSYTFQLSSGNLCLVSLPAALI